MKYRTHVKRAGILSALILLLVAAVPIFAAAVSPPGFSIDLVPVNSSRLPALHSFSIGVSNGEWLVVGGRTNGLHLFVQSSDGGRTPPPNAFPTSKANRRAWVINAPANQAWSTSVQTLPASIADHLSATNAQSYQDGDVLYIIGGYGMDGSTGQMTTFPYLTAIQIPETIQAIKMSQPIGGYIQQTKTYTDCPQFGANVYNQCLPDQTKACNRYQGTPQWRTCMQAAQASCQQSQRSSQAKCMAAVSSGSSIGYPTNDGYYARVTGGGMEKVGNVFYLVFGQMFEGLYSVNEGDYGKWPIRQIYTERVAVMHFNPSPLSAGLLRILQADPNDISRPYHRRDLNVLSVLDPNNGTPRIAVLGGVFVPGEDTGYREPIYINDADNPNHVSVRVDTSYQQVMSQYDCATLKLFGRTGDKSGNMIYAFVGGISLYYLDPKTRTLKIDSGLPFIDDLTVLTHAPDGSYSEFVRSQPLAGLMGADAEFIPHPGIAASPNGVLYLDTLTAKTLMGYVYGGILAKVPNTNGDRNLSDASNAVYEVWITPTPPPAGYWVPTTRTSMAPPPSSVIEKEQTPAVKKK